MWVSRFSPWAILLMIVGFDVRLSATEPTPQSPAPPLLSKDRDPEGFPRIPGDHEPERIVPLPRIAAYADVAPVEQYWIAHRLGTSPENLLLSVGLFNHRNRTLELEIDGRQLTLLPKQNTTLRVPREFVWREKNSAFRVVVIPKDAVGVEIVFPKELR